SIEERLMTVPKLVIRDADRLLHSGELAGPLELGRQRKDEPSPSAAVPCPFLPGSPARLLLAPTTENNVGRQHVLLEPLDSARVRRAPALPPAQLDAMLRWLQSTIGVLQSAVGSSGFLQLAAESLVQIIGLHSGRVLLFDTEPFSIAALFPLTLADRLWQPSQHVLGRVRQEKRTFWQQPHQSG